MPTLPTPAPSTTAPDRVGITLVITYADASIGHYPVPPGQGWKIDAATRCLVIGRGVPRTMVPLDNVHRIDVEEARA